MSLNPKLKELRDRIDAIDVELLDLLRRRADIVEEVRGVKGKLPIYIRPGREADMMRVLLAKPMGHLPKGLIHRLWREMIGAFTLQEGTLRAAVAVGEGDEGMWDYARDHFGVFTPLQEYASAIDALQAVRDGKAEVAVVPVPAGDAGWWRQLLAPEMAHLKIFYRFPFDGVKGNARPARHEALAVADLAPEKTMRDRTILIVEWTVGANDAAAVADLPCPVSGHVRAPGNSVCSWMELEGFNLENPSLAIWREKHKEAILRNRIAGAYPVPLHLERS